MKIIGVSTWMTPNSSSMYFQLTADETIPTSAYSYVTIIYSKNSTIVSSKRLLQGTTIIGDALTGYIEVKDIHEDLLEDYEFTSNISNVTIELEDEILAQAPIDAPLNELGEFKNIAIVSKVKTFWLGFEKLSNRIKSSISSALPDFSESIKFEIEIAEQYAFPGVFEPELITTSKFQELISEGFKIENTGKTYAVQDENGAKKIAFVFLINNTVTVQYAEYEDVYTIVVKDPMSSSGNLVTKIKSPKFIQVENIPVKITYDAMQYESEYFQTTINAMTAPYNSSTIMLTRYLVEELSKTDQHLLLKETGSIVSIPNYFQ